MNDAIEKAQAYMDVFHRLNTDSRPTFSPERELYDLLKLAREQEVRLTNAMEREEVEELMNCKGPCGHPEVCLYQLDPCGHQIRCSWCEEKKQHLGMISKLKDYLQVTYEIPQNLTSSLVLDANLMLEHAKVKYKEPV